MIDLVGVTQYYGARPVLRNVSLTVHPGELVAVMGPNGMGKSTLLKVVAGLLTPLDGHVEIDGLRRRSGEEAERTIRRKLAFLSDHPWLPRNSTGREFLAAVGRLYDVSDRRLLGHIDRLMALFDLEKQADASMGSYSNGQQKKMAISSILVTDAPILVLDEPFTGGLDPAGIVALRRVLKHLAERADVTVLMATQIPEMAEQLAHRVLILRDGEILAFDRLERLREAAGISGSLQNVVEHLIHPDTTAKIDRYFERTP